MVLRVERLWYTHARLLRRFQAIAYKYGHMMTVCQSIAGVRPRWMSRIWKRFEAYRSQDGRVVKGSIILILGTGLKARAIGAVFDALVVRFRRWSSVWATNMPFLIRSWVDCDALWHLCALATEVLSMFKVLWRPGRMWRSLPLETIKIRRGGFEKIKPRSTTICRFLMQLSRPLERGQDYIGRVAEAN